jgi:hypothetical protein
MSSMHRSCPHCSKSVALDTLRKIPRRGELKWYQFTPAPLLACPLCGGFVASNVANSPWWWLVIAPFVAGPLPLFVPSLSFLRHDWWLILFACVLPALAALLILKSHRLVPHSPKHET